MSFRNIIIGISLLIVLTASNSHAGVGQEEATGRKLKAWGGYSGSWSGSWGSSSVNVQPGGQSSGSVNTPYYSGTWGNGGSSGSTTNNQASSSNTQSTSANDAQKAQQDKDLTAAQAPGKVYYNGYGVLVEKLANGSTVTIVNNNYTDVTVVSGGGRKY